MKMTINFKLIVPDESYLDIFESRVRLAVSESHSLLCVQIERKAPPKTTAHYKLITENGYAVFKIAKIHSQIESEMVDYKQNEDNVRV